MEGLRNIRLVVAYDGTDFGGWQRQLNAPSVQAVLEDALAKMHGRAVRVHAAGRTDSGVHARGQVTNFYTDIQSIEATRFIPALNKFLPSSVRVMAAAEAHFDFHARFDARLRRYRYFVAAGRTIDPFTLRFAHRVNRAPDLAVLNSMASALIGEVDFTALSSARDPSPSKRRHVLESSFRWEGGLLVFEIAANAFLLRMVRSIVGSLLHWESTGEGITALAKALETGDRSLSGPTAPARGLFFWNAEYYPEPRKPGRGAYWSRRVWDEDSESDVDGSPPGQGDTVGAGDEAGAPADAGRPVPAEPAPETGVSSPRGRLVPGIGYVRD
jgi:tRNA pseudouridine38-40 synthase